MLGFGDGPRVIRIESKPNLCCIDLGQYRIFFARFQIAGMNIADGFYGYREHQSEKPNTNTIIANIGERV